jgi:hypothetical protein
MDNILVHSGVSPEEMGITINADIQNDFLKLSLKNNIAESVGQSDPVGRLNSQHETLKSSEISEVIAREGGSGLLKVRKIMAVDLYRAQSALQFSYDAQGQFVVTLGMELEGLQP